MEGCDGVWRAVMVCGGCDGVEAVMVWRAVMVCGGL